MSKSKDDRDSHLVFQKALRVSSLTNKSSPNLVDILRLELEHMYEIENVKVAEDQECRNLSFNM